MGIRKASKQSLACIASDSLAVSQEGLFEAIVRHLVVHKYGTVADLCEQTNLSRSTVQARIFKHKQLGSRGLKALANACGVRVEDLTTLPAAGLIKRIDAHLGKQPVMHTMRHSEDPNILFNSLFVAACRSGFSLHGTVRLFVTESLKGGVVKAPEPPSGLRISQGFSLFSKPGTNALGGHKYVTFCVVGVGSNEIEARSAIDSHFLDLANALRAAYGEDGALVILSRDLSESGEGLSALSHLKPILVSNIIQLDEKRAVQATPEYFVELLEKALA